ncbi:MAG: hypothetical protein J0M08_03185 [Bacteroidetes bacterium]|nr:hypothetical protein [Bacteroidota bacterium]
MKFFNYLSLLLIWCISACTTESAKQTNNNNTDTASIATTSVAASKEKAPVYNGVHEEKYSNGVLKMKGEYAGGLRQGQWFAWYEDGKLWSECFYTNGLRDGANIVYYPNEIKRYEGFFKDDKPTGVWKFYDETGKLTEEKKYE